MATVTATQTAPVRTGATAGAGQAGGSSDTGFGALLAALVPGGAATGGAPGTTTAPAPTPAGVCGAGPEVSVSTDEAVVGAADSTQVVVGATGDDTAGSRTGDPGTGTASETTDGTDATASGPTADPVLGVDAALLAQAQLAALPLLAATNPVTPVVAAGSGQRSDEAAGVDALATLAAAAGPGTAEAGAPATPVAGAGTDGAADQSAQQSPDQQPSAVVAAPTAAPAVPVADPSASAATAALTATAPTTALAPTTTAGEARPADAVPGQVFPEVVRLSQAGPGTHRMVLRLDPGTLGEVRVTLTVRDGEVQVRLAAQQDAREVLAQAAPDLRRLLEQSGTVDARVAVADLTSGTTTDLSGDAWSDRGAGAGTDADPDQRPGPYDEHRGGSGPQPEQPTAPERTRGTRTSSGLDVAL